MRCEHIAAQVVNLARTQAISMLRSARARHARSQNRQMHSCSRRTEAHWCAWGAQEATCRPALPIHLAALLFWKRPLRHKQAPAEPLNAVHELALTAAMRYVCRTAGAGQTALSDVSQAGFLVGPGAACCNHRHELRVRGSKERAIKRKTFGTLSIGLCLRLALLPRWLALCPARSGAVKQWRGTHT